MRKRLVTGTWTDRAGAPIRDRTSASQLLPCRFKRPELGLVAARLKVVDERVKVAFVGKDDDKHAEDSLT